MFYSPANDIHIGFITYPANINALVVAGVVRRQRHLLVVPADGDRGDRRAGARLGPEGQFRLGRGAGRCASSPLVYLGLMLVNVVVPTGLSSPRGYFNLDWITLS